MQSVLIHQSFPPLITGPLSFSYQPLQADQLILQQLLPGQGLLYVLVKLVQVLGWYGCSWARVHYTGAGLGFLPIWQVQLECCYDTPVGDLATVLHNIHTELQDITRANLSCRALLRTLAESLVIDKGSITRLRVLQIKLPILVP